MVAGAPVEPGHMEKLTPKRRPWWTRISGGHLFMVLAGILAFLVNLIVLRGHDDTVLVAAAATDLAAGHVIGPSDVGLVEIDADAQVLAGLVAGPAVSAIEGLITSHPVGAGDLIIAGSLMEQAAPSGLRALAIPVAREHAAGGGIRVGDRVDVISVEDGTASYVLVGAEVLSVPGPERSGLAATAFHLVVAVDDQEALVVSRAIRTGAIEVLVATGASSPTSLTYDPLEEAG